MKIKTNESIQWSGTMYHYKAEWLKDIIQTNPIAYAVIGYKHGGTTLYSYGTINGWDSKTNKTYKVLWSSGGSTLKIKIAYTGEI